MTRPTIAAPPAHAGAPDGLRIYYLHPLLAGPMGGWGAQFQRIAALGFSRVLVAQPFRPMRHGSVMLSATHDALHPALGWTGSAGSGLAEMARLARAAGLGLMLDVVLDRVADGSPLALQAGGPFSLPDVTLDPRRFDPDGDAAHAGRDAQAGASLVAFWIAQLERLATWEIGGFRLIGIAQLAPDVITGLCAGLAGSGAQLLGWMAGVPIDRLRAFEGCGLHGVFNSLPWWDGKADWFWREDSALRRIAPVIASTEAPFGARLGELVGADPASRAGAQRRGLALAALLGSGWMLPMGGEYGATRRMDPRRDTPEDWGRLCETAPGDLGAVITALNQARADAPALSSRSIPRLLSGPGADTLAVVRPSAADPRLAGDAALVAINMRLADQATFELTGAGANLGGYYRLEAARGVHSLLPGGFWCETLPWKAPHAATVASMAVRDAVRAPRIAIEAVAPSVDNGRFAARVCVGDRVSVSADIICDGHDVLAAALRWQTPGQTGEHWHQAPMRPLGNDRWSADLPLHELGVHRFTVQAWKDVFATYRDELAKKFAAGLDVTLEVTEGSALVARAETSAGERLGDVRTIVQKLRAEPLAGRIALLLSDDLAALMRAVDQRAFATWIEPALPIEAERTAARFASWYEIFPRSASGDITRHGTFADVVRQLPRIRDMGFDVLYFPPIHPIGKVNRKGRNNTLHAGADDPGSPYGIADHMALHEELGTFEEFRALRDAAFEHGLELALDFAVQCSPDHPWLTGHKGWFDWRPDGSIRYAENPPKKYQDIVNVDFYKPESTPDLWETLRDVVLFWCDQGVRIFRVDNPHTKPLPFWEWLIGAIHDRFPDTLFLAEAFTKPKMMSRLAKIGFSQSYTYFTWRQTKAEFETYMAELTTTSLREFFRPNFFVNTPDINPVFLQQSGRPGHLIRAALAALLAGLWGVYSGFELCEATPLPGREEYLDSEKYEIKAWDWARPGNIVREITQLNGMRRLNPALQSHLGVTFLQGSSEQILCFEKATPDRSNVVVVAINLDPTGVQETAFEVPLWRWNLQDSGSVHVDDLVFETSFAWHGKMQHVRLDPHNNPYAVWRVRPL